MNLSNKTLLSLLGTSLFLSITLITYSAEAKIYKWTDEKGKVHYSDKPFDKHSKEIKVNKQLTPAQQLKAKAEAQKIIQQQNRRLRTQFEEESDRKKLEAKHAKEKYEYEKACKDAKQGLTTLQMQRPVYEQKENGEREFYSDERRKNEISELKKIIAEHCSS